ncbi:MAG: RNA methyltransferase [Acidobacteriota bacterium]
MPTADCMIQSRHNQHYKRWQRYVSHPEKQECPWIPVEGHKQIEELSRDHSIELLLFSDTSQAATQPFLSRSRQSQCLSEGLLERLSSVRSPQHMVAFFEKPTWKLEDLTSWVLYLDQVQDPGNLGTLLRTARATGMFSVVTSPRSVACYNSKVIRASAASLFTVPFLEGLDLESLTERGYALCLATLQDGPSLYEVRLEAPQAIIIGNEGSGPADSTLAMNRTNLHIPMRGQTQSLNAAVAGSLILYEIFRQKELNG